MARHKTEEFKNFQISERKKIGSGLTNAPVWIMQKAGKRIWNSRQKRTWKTIDIKYRFDQHKRKQAKIATKSGNHGKWKKNSRAKTRKVENKGE
jgi:hypothetical protein